MVFTAKLRTSCIPIYLDSEQTLPPAFTNISWRPSCSLPDTRLCPLKSTVHSSARNQILWSTQSMKSTCLGYGPSTGSESAGREKGQRLSCNQFLNRPNYTTSTFFSLSCLSNLISPQETCLQGKVSHLSEAVQWLTLNISLTDSLPWTVTLFHNWWWCCMISAGSLEVHWNGVKSARAQSPIFAILLGKFSKLL